MVTATPFKLAVGDEKTQLTKPINFKPPMAKNTGKSKNTVTNTVPANMLLVGGIIGIFILFIVTTKERLFSFRNKRLITKRHKAKKWAQKLRKNNWRNLNVLSPNNAI